MGGHDAGGRRREGGRQQGFAGRPVGGGATALPAVLLQGGPGTVGGRQEILLGHPLDELVLAAGRGRMGGRARRGGRVEGALAAQVAQEPLAPPGPREPEGFEEGRPEFGGHDVVEDGIDGGIEVEHDSTKVEHVVVRLGSHHLDVLVRRQDEPQGEDLEGQEADEEEDDDRAQHGHHLATGPQVGVDVVRPGRHRRRRLHL